MREPSASSTTAELRSDVSIACPSRSVLPTGAATLSIVTWPSTDTSVASAGCERSSRAGTLSTWPGLTRFGFGRRFRAATSRQAWGVLKRLADRPIIVSPAWTGMSIIGSSAAGGWASALEAAHAAMHSAAA